MVSTYQMPSFYRPTPLTVDTTQAQKYYEEEDHSILDETILDHSALDSGLEMSPPMVDSRRDSFAVGGSLFSPKTEDWQSVDMQSVPSNNPFIEQQHNNNPFMRLDHAQPSPFAPQGNGWSLSNTSGSCTPLQQFDGMPAEYDNGAPMFQRPVPGQTPFTNPTGQINMFAPIGSGNQSIPTSPQKGWIGQAESMAKKMRPGSPTIRSHNDMRRGDGIRKKNARFDIPAERNLSNIDHLIAQSTDEQEIKELKQQKRLLRNRQAALDSRQRKKQHTERLEDEKKQFTAVLTDLEEEMADMRKQMEQLLREKQFNQEYIESLTMEKEEMIRSHTIETGELRKKVSVLTDHVQRLESAAMTAPANNNYVSGYDDMDGMTMPGSWDNVNFLGEYPMEQEVKQELQVVPNKKADVSFPVDSEKSSSQGGILFMLFLVGAFVLSSRSTPAIPRVSEDVRAEAATLLENVFKDAGVNGASNTLNGLAPQPSGGSWVDNSAMPMSDTSMGGVAPSMLGQLGDSLTQPTDEQANEQLFGLSAAQYNGVSSQDFLNNAPERTTSQGRKNLADALSAMRTNKQSAADVYTRSLLWDQIPSEVVRNFAKMVSESNSAKAGANE
ncbi:bZIP transcription factor [Colletotrichum abscissum]|uniref:BZIP transcription factor n=1 Tax=Colletotrichum abscissum TaxID=1671311 RepID=A0A9P9XM66_9PEZI|nr:bZIP transcription factor [Colletotrichum abscissum]KAI3556568.1 bZIP transcription factor [Colletotrichum abscissum]KAK1473611.1 bZIP transcription factor [Colletotrichum abscissum]